MSSRRAAPRSLEAWLRYQESLHHRGVDLSLERVREVAERLGLLGRHAPVAIVGGTNGKGSTATMLAALLRACGRRVGLFTSPHLVRYNERVWIDGREATDAALIAAFERIERARGAVTLTLFEFSTLAALELFRESGVTAMVLEVGLGGRLDATNLLDADVAILCSVGLDHRDWLGATLEQIGAEKAGIFRPGQAAVLGSAQMPASVWRRLEELHCRVYLAQRDYGWHIHGGGFAFEPWDYRAASGALRRLPAPSLPGAVQYANAAAALTALELLEPDAFAAPERIAAALRALTLAGRFQRVPGPVEWILDVAHNEPAAQVLAAALDALPIQGRTLAVAGILADKDAAAIARALDPHVDEWLLAGIDEGQRGQSAAQLAARLPPLRGAVRLHETVETACQQARERAVAGDRVVVLGSFHVVGPALTWLGLY